MCLRERAEKHVGARQAAIDKSANQAPEDKLIAGYGQPYREWLIHGA
jgi:hypothetical protein